MHPAERKLGNVLCDFPGELASYSASELAELAGVSPATVSRFVRRLGYESYEEARRHAREERETGSLLYLASREARQADASLQSYHAQNVDNLQRTWAGIDMDQVDQIADTLLAARKTWVFGFRASQAFATYLRWQLLQVIEGIVVLPGAGETLGEHLVNLQPEDLVIFFGLRRRVAQSEAILAEIARSGARLLYIGDEGAPARTDITWHLRCETRSPGSLFSHVAVMGVCHLLASRTIERAGQGGRSRLRRIGAVNEVLDEL